MALLAHRPPPAADRVDGEAGGIVIGADANPADIVVDVVDAVRYGAAQLGIDEVVHVDRLGPALATPFPAVVLEIADQFLLLGVDRHHWLTRRQELQGLRVDVLELRVAIDVLAAFPRLAVGLQTVAQVMQQLADNRRANPVSATPQRRGQMAQAAARPQQRPHRVAPRRRLDQTLQLGQQASILRCLLLPATTCPADAAERHRRGMAKVRQSLVNRRARQTGHPRHQADAAAAQGARLQGGKAPPALLAQNRRHRPISPPRRARLRCSDHDAKLRHAIPSCESQPPLPSLAVALMTHLFSDEP